MAAKFEIRSPKPGEYRWVLVSQGRILATSEPYRRKGLAEKATVSFRMVAVNAPVADMTRPAAKTPTRKAARVTGRALATAVMKGARAVEKTEKTAAKATKAARRTVATASKSQTGKANKTSKR